MTITSTSLPFEASPREAESPVLPRRRASSVSNGFIYLVLWISILRPFPNVLAGSSFGISRVLDLVTMAIAALFLMGCLALRGTVARPRGLAWPVWVFALLSVLLPLAYWNAIVVHNEATGVRDAFELLRFPLMLVMLLFLAQGRVHRGNLRDFLHKGFVIPFWIVVFLCLAELTKMPVVCELKQMLWSQSKNTIALSAHYVRMSGTMENPNWFSLYLNMMLALFLFFEPRSVKSLAAIILCIGLVVLTGSRTGIIGLFLVTLAYTTISGLRMVKHPLTALVRLAVVVGFLLVGLHLMGSVGNIRILRSVSLIRAKGLLSVQSVSVRASQVKTLVARYLDEPRLLGFGPSKYSVADVIDNQYAEYLVRYGVVGLSLMVSTHLWYIGAALALRRRCRPGPVRDYALFVCVLAGLMLAYFATGQFGDILRLSFLYLGLIIPVFLLPREGDRTPRTQAHAPHAAPACLPMLPDGVPG